MSLKEQQSDAARIATLTARVTLLEKENAALRDKVAMLDALIDKAISTGKTYGLEDYKWPNLAKEFYGEDSNAT